MKLIEYYNLKHMTYREISLKCKSHVQHDEAFHAVKNPWRLTFEKYLAVARVLGMPDEMARDEWAIAKAEHSKMLADKQINRVKITQTRKSR